MAEPLKYYDPHAPAIAAMTSNSYACVPDDLESHVGRPRKTWIIHVILSSKTKLQDIAVLQ